jgi:hypothetical protein
MTEAFDKARESVAYITFLMFPDPDKELYLDADASNLGSITLPIGGRWNNEAACTVQESRIHNGGNQVVHDRKGMMGASQGV